MEKQSMSEDEVRDLCSLAEQTCSELRDAIQRATPEQQLKINVPLQDLKNAVDLVQISASFHRSMGEVEKNWVPRGTIERVVQACCQQLYDADCIEAIFYQQGDIPAVLALNAGTKGKTALFTVLHHLPLDHKEELAREFGRYSINSVVSAWSTDYDKTCAKLEAIQGDPPRLYRLCKDKEKGTGKRRERKKKEKETDRYGRVDSDASETGEPVSPPRKRAKSEQSLKFEIKGISLESPIARHPLVAAGKQADGSLGSTLQPDHTAFGPICSVELPPLVSLLPPPAGMQGVEQLAIGGRATNSNRPASTIYPHQREPIVYLENPSGYNSSLPYAGSDSSWIQYADWNWAVGTDYFCDT